MLKPVYLISSVAIFAFLLAPVLAAAQAISSSQIVDFIWVKAFKFQVSWLSNPNQLILQAIIPSIAIYAIFLGLMRTLRIFQGMGNMEHLIALTVMFAALFTGGIGYVSGLLAFLGNWSVAIFFVMMFVGSILYARGFFKSVITPTQELSWAYKASVRKLGQKISWEEKKIRQMKLDYQKKSQGWTVGQRARWSMKIADEEALLEKHREELRRQAETFKDALQA